MNDERTHVTINSKLFKRLGHNNNQIYKLELAKSEIKSTELIILVISQFSKLSKMELYYNISTSFSDTDNFEEMETDTYSMYSAVAEKVCMIVYEVRKSKSANIYVIKTVIVFPVKKLATNVFLVL